MKILIVGGGGREHALAWKVNQSPLVDAVYVAPGNAGTESEPGICNVNIAAGNTIELVDFAVRSGIDLTIIGPEDPLVDGIVDRFQDAGLKCFGPSKKASQLEGSKTFTKEFLERHSIPTAAYKSFTELSPALEYLAAAELPVVIKADGLAAGKGVIIAESREQGKSAITDMLAENRFGQAGNKVVIEEFLQGEEASFICMVDGKNVLEMASSQDHKAAYNGDTGPNTGGMGAYSPAPVVDAAMHKAIMDQVIRPTVTGLAAEGIPYTGFLYAGVMIGGDGVPRVLEYNCRFGDPETQPIMMRLQSDLVEHCLSALAGELDQETAVWDSRAALGVVIAANGYPGAYRSGDIIRGLNIENRSDSKIFHAGTRYEEGAVITSGGRVLCATALGPQIEDAHRLAYELARSIHWEGCWYRDDIGYRAIGRNAPEGV
jgi:phosphoribosylamine--glycine ligase